MGFEIGQADGRVVQVHNPAGMAAVKVVAHNGVPGGGEVGADLMAGAGEVSLKIQKLRWQTFATAILERYRRRES